MKPYGYLVVSFLFISCLGFSQSRIFLSTGSSLSTDYEVSEFYATGIGNAVWSTDGSYLSKGFMKYFTFDIEVESRLNRFFVVSGLRFFNSGYSNSYYNNFSSLHSHHLGIPLLMRLNIDNYVYADVGAIIMTTMKATLEETALKGSVYETSDKRNIAPYLSPINLGFNLQYSLVVNRFFITGYSIMVREQVNESLKDNWYLGKTLRNNSLFLRDMSPGHRIILFGVKLGVRIK